MSVARSARPEPVDARAPPRSGAGTARFAELLAAKRSARPPGYARAEVPARAGRAPARPVPPPSKGISAAEAAFGAVPADPPSCGLLSPDLPGAAAPDAPGAAEVRACIRAAPAVLAAGVRPGAAELALTFGSALSLDVRSGAQGLELTLRPATGLERTTRAELPGLVDALRARGLRVARAEVRPRGPTPRRAR
jgi:hypothetical protein